MTKQNNVNPDHYKVAGRERPGDGLERAKEPAHKRTAVRSGAGSPNYIPGAAAVGEPDDRMAQTRERARQAVSKAKKK